MDDLCQATGEMVKDKSWQRWLGRLFQALLLGLIAVFLVASLFNGWDEVASHTWRFDFVLLAAAAFCFLINVIGQAVVWTWSIRQMLVDLPYKSGIRIFLVSQLAKYIPGGVWSFANVAYSGQKLGFSGSLLTLTFLLISLLDVAASALLALPVLPGAFPGIHVRLDVLAWLMAAVGLLVGPLVLRWTLYRIAGWKRLDLSLVPIDRVTSYTALAAKFMLILCLHTIGLLSFGLFLRATMEVTWMHAIQASFIWNAAWLVGFLVLFAPSGLGVREYVLILLLQPIAPQAVAVTISIAHRVFLTALDFVLLLIVGVSQLRTLDYSFRKNSKYPSE